MSDSFLRKIVWAISHTKFSLLPLDISYGFKREGISRKVYEDILADLKPGDIIFTGQNSYVASLVNSGRVSHVAIYMGDQMGTKYLHGVVHAVEPRVMVQELAAVTVCDYLEVYSPLVELTQEEVRQLADRLDDIVSSDVKYDNRFVSTLEHSKEEAELEMYCSELVTYAYAPIIQNHNIIFKKGSKLGVDAYLPSSFIHDGEGFKRVYSSESL